MQVNAGIPRLAHKLSLPLRRNATGGTLLGLRIGPAMHGRDIKPQHLGDPGGPPALPDDVFSGVAHETHHASILRLSQAYDRDFLDGPAQGIVNYGGMPDLLATIRQALKEQKGKSQKGLAEAMGINESQVSRMLQGARAIKVDEIPKIASYLNVMLPVTVGDRLVREEISQRRIPILGEVAAGAWLEAPVMHPLSEPGEYVPFVPADIAADPGLFALRVRGTSINNIAPDGSLLICVRYSHSGRDLDHNELVIVERQDADGTFETTAKRARRGKQGAIELWPDSNDPRHQAPIVLTREAIGDSAEVRVIGRVKHVVITV